MYIHRHGIGGKTDVKIGIEVVNSLDKSYTSDLKKIVRILFSVRKTLNYAQYKPQIAVYQLTPSFLVAVFEFY